MRGVDCTKRCPPSQLIVRWFVFRDAGFSLIPSGPNSSKPYLTAKPTIMD